MIKFFRVLPLCFLSSLAFSQPDCFRIDKKSSSLKKIVLKDASGQQIDTLSVTYLDQHDESDYFTRAAIGYCKYNTEYSLYFHTNKNLMATYSVYMEENAIHYSEIFILDRFTKVKHGQHLLVSYREKETVVTGEDRLVDYITFNPPVEETTNTSLPLKRTQPMPTVIIDGKIMRLMLRPQQSENEH